MAPILEILLTTGIEIIKVILFILLHIIIIFIGFESGEKFRHKTTAALLTIIIVTWIDLSICIYYSTT